MPKGYNVFRLDLEEIYKGHFKDGYYEVFAVHFVDPSKPGHVHPDKRVSLQDEFTTAGETLKSRSVNKCYILMDGFEV